MFDSSAPHNVWGLLPGLVLVLWVMRGRVRQGGWLESCLTVVPWLAGGVWVGSNFLSFAGLLQPLPLRWAWIAVAVVSVVLCWRSIPRRVSAGESFSFLSPWSVSALLTGGALAALALVMAWVSPPVNVDVLSYHGPRQLYWLQQGSLAHFLTINDRQLLMPPLAELIGLQFIALTGGDQWANMPQWFAYVLLPLGVVSTLRILGARPEAVWFGAILVMLLPMAYLEASNGKNDLQAAMWTVLLLREVARGRTVPRIDVAMAVRAGLILAMGLMTKSTLFIYGPPLVAAGMWSWWWRDRLRAPRLMLVAALVVAVLSTPFFWRNMAWYGSPLGVQKAEEGGDQAVSAMSPGLFVSNFVRNASSHLAAPFPGWNQGLEEGVRRVHSAMGLSAEDRRNTLWTMNYGVAYAPRTETQAGAPWHLILIGTALALVFCGRRLRGWRWIGVILVVMLVLYCGLLKWQPWGARLHLPGFVVGVVLVAGIASAMHFRPQWLMGLAAAGAGLVWLPSWEETTRPLLTSPTLFEQDRELNMVRHWTHMKPRNESIVQLLREANARSVMLVSVHDMAYPLMLRMRRELPGVHFYGAPVSDGQVPPDAIVALELFQPVNLYHQFGDTLFRLVGDHYGDGVFLPSDRVLELGWADRLPNFAGWLQGPGIRFRIALLADDQSIMVWEVEEALAKVAYETDIALRRLRGAVRGVSLAHDQSLSIWLNGSEVAAFDLVAGPEETHFEYALPGNPGKNMIEFRRDPTAQGAIEFTALVVSGP